MVRIMSRYSVELEPAAIEDADILTETCRKAFDSDSEFGAPGPGGPPGYDSLEWNIDKIKNRYLHYYKILAGDEIVGVNGASVKGRTKVEVARMIQGVKVR